MRFARLSLIVSKFDMEGNCSMKMMIKFFGVVIFLLAIFVFNGNILAQAKTEILIVADKMANCPGSPSSGNCLQVKRINEEKFTTINESIENFQFVPGAFYLLEVSVTLTAANSSTNSSKLKYHLEKILARVKSDNSSTTTAEFSLTEWKLTRVDGSAVKSESAFIKFDEQQKTVVGNGGCNPFNGSLTKNGNQIKMPEIFATKKFCNEISLVEIKFLTNLDRVTRYAIDGTKLKLFAGDAAVLEFEARK
jgi:heat shock protein HslJ